MFSSAPLFLVMVSATHLFCFVSNHSLANASKVALFASNSFILRSCLVMMGFSPLPISTISSCAFYVLTVRLFLDNRRYRATTIYHQVFIAQLPRLVTIGFDAKI